MIRSAAAAGRCVCCTRGTPAAGEHRAFHPAVPLRLDSALRNSTFASSLTLLHPTSFAGGYSGAGSRPPAAQFIHSIQRKLASNQAMLFDVPLPLQVEILEPDHGFQPCRPVVQRRKLASKQPLTTDNCICFCPAGGDPGEGPRLPALHPPGARQLPGQGAAARRVCADQRAAVRAGLRLRHC